MKTRDLAIYVIGGGLAAGILVWTTNRMVHPPVAPGSPAVTRATPAPPPPSQSLESVPRIDPAEFSKRLERGEIVVIDVRDVADYTNAHIPGAIHIPLSFMQGELPYLPRGKPIVTYCT